MNRTLNYILVSILICFIVFPVYSWKRYRTDLRIRKKFDVNRAIFLGEMIEISRRMLQADPDNINPEQPEFFPENWEMIGTLYVTAGKLVHQKTFMGYFARSKENPDRIILIIHGTSTVKQMFVNFKTDFTEFDPVPRGGKIEKGFSRIYQSIRVFPKLSETGRPEENPNITETSGRPENTENPEEGDISESALEFSESPSEITGKEISDDLISGAKEAGEESFNRTDDPVPMDTFMESIITENTRLTMSGYSLGGALVTINAVICAEKYPRIPLEVYTFASPLVGNWFFSRAYNKRVKNSYRIYNIQDIITCYPDGDFYTHVNYWVSINSRRFGFKKGMLCEHDIRTYIHILGSRKYDVGELKRK